LERSRAKPIALDHQVKLRFYARVRTQLIVVTSERTSHSVLTNHTLTLVWILRNTIVPSASGRNTYA